MININSLENKKIKEVVKLRKSGLQKSKELFLIDGKREIELALKSGVTVKEIFYCSDFSPEDSRLLDKIDQEKIIIVSRNVFQKIAYKENPDGFLAIATRSANSLNEIKLTHNPLVIILESVEKPGNLGAILRTAYAAGVEAVIINNNQTDIFNQNVIRASEGHIFTNKIVISSVKETADWLKNNKIQSFAAAIKQSKNYLQSDFSGPSAIILGSEAEGLSKNWLKLADSRILIEMKSGIDSLNVSVSAAIIVFEALRQRNIS
jgi:TrmH family RNA methyltransferase